MLCPIHASLRFYGSVALIALIVLFVKGARERWGSRIAFVAIALVLCYWTFLGFAHSRAIARGSEEAAKMATANGETVAQTCSDAETCESVSLGLRL